MKFVKVGEKNRVAFDHLFNLYLHDLSEYTIYVAAQLDDQGIYMKGITDSYFNKDTDVFLIYLEDQIAGFIVMSWGDIPDHKADYMIQEFFILRPYRKTGLARRVIRAIFRTYPGTYSIHVLKKNMHAHRFWRKCITSAGAKFTFLRMDDQQDGYVFEIKKDFV